MQRTWLRLVSLVMVGRNRAFLLVWSGMECREKMGRMERREMVAAAAGAVLAAALVIVIEVEVVAGAAVVVAAVKREPAERRAGRVWLCC